MTAFRSAASLRSSLARSALARRDARFGSSSGSGKFIAGATMKYYREKRRILNGRDRSAALLTDHRRCDIPVDMKIVLSCLAVLCFSASVGFAGPEALPDGKEMKQVAPAPPSCPNWAGFYAGIFGGYKFSVVNTDLDLGGLWENNPLVPAILDHQHDMDNSGAELGGVIGYNFQFGKWVLGGEFDGGYLWAREFKADTFPDDGRTYYNSQ